MNYEFNLLHHVGVVAKRVRAAAAHKGDANTHSSPTGRGVKTTKGSSTPSKGCVCQKLKQSMHGLSCSAQHRKRKCGHPDAGQTDIRGGANNPPPPLRRVRDKKSVQHLVIKKAIFCFKLKLLKSAFYA